MLQGAETFVTAVDVAREARCGRCCSGLPESVAARGRGRGSGSGVSVVRGAGGNGFEQRTEGVHAYSKDEVGHFISRLTSFYSEAMDDVGLTDEQIVDVVNRVSDKLVIDMLTQDYGEIPAPTDN